MHIQINFLKEQTRKDNKRKKIFDKNKIIVLVHYSTVILIRNIWPLSIFMDILWIKLNTATFKQPVNGGNVVILDKR